MTIPPVNAAGLDFTGVTGSHKTDSPEKIKEAASQFEALMIGQILKAAHGDSDQGSFGDEADPASASAMDFANDYFARAMAAKGGLGLTNMIVAGLEKQATSGAHAPTAPKD
jgi:Rod binding domain-containing protein